MSAQIFLCHIFIRLLTANSGLLLKRQAIGSPLEAFEQGSYVVICATQRDQFERGFYGALEQGLQDAIASVRRVFHQSKQQMQWSKFQVADRKATRHYMEIFYGNQKEENLNFTDEVVEINKSTHVFSKVDCYLCYIYITTKGQYSHHVNSEFTK